MKRTTFGLLVAFLLLFPVFIVSVQFSEAKPGAFEVEWQQLLSGISGSAVVQTSNGGYLVLGTNASWVQVNDLGDRTYENQQSILINTDQLGNSVWEKTYQVEGARLELSSIVETDDGGYALGGIAIFEHKEEGKW